VNEPATHSDVAAGIAPAPPPIPAPDDAATPPAPDAPATPAGSATTALSEPAVADPAPPPATTAPDRGAPPPAKVSRRIARFIDGEVQEFRDGVTREVAAFRSGYAKVRDFFRRRDARSPAR
jgi:hypothetical protein